MSEKMFGNADSFAIWSTSTSTAARTIREAAAGSNADAAPTVRSGRPDSPRRSICRALDNPDRREALYRRMKFVQFANAGFVGAGASGCRCGSFSIGSLNPWSGPPNGRGRCRRTHRVRLRCRKRLVVGISGGKSVMIVFPGTRFRRSVAPAAGRASPRQHDAQLQGDRCPRGRGAVTYSNCRKAAG